MKLIVSIFMLMLFLTPLMASEEEPICQALEAHTPMDNVNHTPSADVSAAGQSAFVVPEIVQIPLESPLAQRVQALTGQPIKMDAPLGMMEIHRDGSIRYNDENWTLPIKTLCAQKPPTEIEAEEVKINEASLPSKMKPILNSGTILNNAPIIKAPQGTMAEKPEAPDVAKTLEKIEAAKAALKEDGAVAEVENSAPDPVAIEPAAAASEDMEQALEITPTQAVPPQDIRPDMAADIDPPEIEIINNDPSDIIEGGAYRDNKEIFFNE